MSVFTPTLIPRDPHFPRLLPKPPQPHLVPLPIKRVYAHLNAFRDIQREMDDLSDEENELEDLNNAVHNRGFSFLVPIGRSLTRQEEKNDAEDDSDESGSAHSGGAPSVLEDDGENDSAQDLDASMEDLDDEGTADTDEQNEGDTEEYEEDASDAISLPFHWQILSNRHVQYMILEYFQHLQNIAHQRQKYKARSEWLCQSRAKCGPSSR